MTDLLLHACCGPCSTVSVPAWRERGVEPVAWFENPNIQPDAELERRRESMLRFSRASGLELILPEAGGEAPGWVAWRESLASAEPDERCRACLGMRLDAAGAAARALGFGRFSTTLTVSPYQRHDLIVRAGEAAARRARRGLRLPRRARPLPRQLRGEPPAGALPAALLRVRGQQVGGVARAPRPA